MKEFSKQEENNVSIINFTLEKSHTKHKKYFTIQHKTGKIKS